MLRSCHLQTDTLPSSLIFFNLFYVFPLSNATATTSSTISNKGGESDHPGLFPKYYVYFIQIFFPFYLQTHYAKTIWHIISHICGQFSTVSNFNTWNPILLESQAVVFKFMTEDLPLHSRISFFYLKLNLGHITAEFMTYNKWINFDV